MSSSSSASRDVPWQWEWKRPQWQSSSLDLDNNNHHQETNLLSLDGTPLSSSSSRDDWKVLSSSSAQVIRDEIPSELLPTLEIHPPRGGGDNNNNNTVATVLFDESIFWVTVTILVSNPSSASTKTSKQQQHSHVVHVLVELFQQPNHHPRRGSSGGSGEVPTAPAAATAEKDYPATAPPHPIQRLYSRQLQWPESALMQFDEEEDEEENGDAPQRQPQNNNDDEQKANKAKEGEEEEEMAKGTSLQKNKHNNNFWMQLLTGDAMFHHRRTPPQPHLQDDDGNRPNKAATKNSTTWLTAVALCRAPPQAMTSTTNVTRTTTTTANSATSTSDALDAINFLSFGLVPIPGTTMTPTTSVTRGSGQSTTSTSSPLETTEPATHNNHEVENRDTTTTTTPPSSQTSHPPTTTLLLACLTTSGKIHIYSLWKLLQPTKSEQDNAANDDDDDDTLTRGWLELWLGAPMHQHLQRTIRPLSHPMVTVSLSTVAFQRIEEFHQQQQQKQPTTSNNKASVADPSVMTDDDDHAHQEKEEDEQDQNEEDDDMAGNLPPLWDEVIWDSSIEPSTAMYRTVDNVPKLCVPAFQYLAIAGKGIRKRHHASKGGRPRSKPPQHVSSTGKAKMTHGSTTIHVHQEPQNVDASEQEQHVDGSVASDASHASASASSVPSVTTTTTTTTSRSRRPAQQQQHAVGGFVTLVSLYNYSEIRTLFLPFVPERLSPVVWGDMTFLLVIPTKGRSSRTSSRHRYPYRPVAIRIDSQPNDGIICCGQVPFLVSNMTNSFNEELSSKRSSNEPEQQFCSIPRFKLVPILLPQEEVYAALDLIGSSPDTFPPAMAVMQTRTRSNSEGEVAEELLVSMHTWEAIDIIPKQLVDVYLRTSPDSVIPAIITQHPSSHVARIPVAADHGTSERCRAWCLLGQGWCLVGQNGSVFFISWEGATSSRGAYVKQVGTYEGTTNHPVPNLILPPFPNTFKKRVLQNTSRVSDSSRLSEPRVKSLLTAISEIESAEEEALGDDETDEILLEALESISGLTYREPGSSPNSSISSSRRRSSFNHRERSSLLLRHCNSWTQLDDVNHNRNHVANQVPLLSFRSSARSSDSFVLSLRRIVVENGEAAPFNDVLSWMSQQEDFFTAASVALALLRDAETLRHLWRATEHIEADEELSKLEGLLDGIVPLNNFGDAVSNERQLADMTLGCLIKGGFAMSSTLELFVSHDIHYDPSRACLMLVAATACTVSGDEETMKSAMGRNYDRNDSHEENILWPVRCLLQLGVARGYLAKALILLNATIPDEIRRRKPSGSVAAPAPSMKLCSSLVSLVVGSAPDAAELLLGLVDQQSRSRFWQSLDHETKLGLALVSISGKSPMLRQAEVRAWARLQLNECIKDEMSASGVNVYEVMPTEWLRQLCMACFCNAGCNLTYLLDPSSADDPADDDADHIEHHARAVRMTRNALVAAKWSGGLDFDLVIPGLLLLSSRGSRVQDDFHVSTQAVLDAACYLAGRPGTEESMFVFDGATVMRLCATSGNVSAGAHLIGGKNGLVLKCCDILMQEVGMTMDDAEGFLVNDDVNLQTVDSLIQFESLRFVVNEGHHHLLRLLDEYVLKVRTYGDFQTDNARGKVDPIFAARCFFRTWLCLTTPDTTNGSIWLVNCLRSRLGMEQEAISRRRLACAAILRSLIWPPNNKAGMVDLSSSQQLLANALNVESRFLVQLAQSCCGLVEALPSWVAEDVIRSLESSGQASSSQLTLEV